MTRSGKEIVGNAISGWPFSNVRRSREASTSTSSSRTETKGTKSSRLPACRAGRAAHSGSHRLRGRLATATSPAEGSCGTQPCASPRSLPPDLLRSPQRAVVSLGQGHCGAQTFEPQELPVQLQPPPTGGTLHAVDIRDVHSSQLFTAWLLWSLLLLWLLWLLWVVLVVFVVLVVLVG